MTELETPKNDFELLRWLKAKVESLESKVAALENAAPAPAPAPKKSAPAKSENS